jgi:hypothetical protein
MDTSKILNDLRAERERIDRAIAALEALTPNATQTAPGTQSLARARAGRKPSSAKQASASTTGGRTMSPAARRRISLAAKKRWAEKKNAAQPQATAKQTAPKQTAAKQAKKAGLTAAGRKRLSENMKKRWAAKKKAAAKAA